MYKVALRDCEKAIELNEKKSEFYNLRGMVLMNLEDYEQALKDFNVCLYLNEKFGSGYHNRGRIYIIYNKFNEALLDFMKAIQYRPKDPIHLIYKA